MIKKYFLIFLLLGFVLRLILAGISSWNYDIVVWYRFALDLQAGFGPYGHYNFSYPPGLAAFFAATILPLLKLVAAQKWAVFNPSLYAVQSWIIDPTITSPIFNYLIKLPLIGAEIIFLYLLYRYIKDRISAEKARLALILWYLNPLIIFAIAVHGQLDIYPVLFLFLAVLLLYLRNFFLAGLMMGLAISMKIYPAFLILPFLAIIWSAWYRKTLPQKMIMVLKFILGLLPPLIFLAAYLFLNSKAYELSFNRFQVLGIEGSLNLGSIVYIPTLVSFIQNHAVLLGRIQAVGLIFSTIFATVLLIFRYQKSSKLVKAFPLEVVSLLVIFIVYLFLQRTNPNYLLWTFPFLLVIIAKRPKYQIYYYLLSAAAIIFYLAINSFTLGIFFLPLAQYFPQLKASVAGIAGQYLYLYSHSGIINQRMMFDAFLFSASIFVFSIILLWSNLLREFRRRD